MTRIPGPARSERQEHLDNLHFAVKMAEDDHEAAKTALQRRTIGQNPVELEARVGETADQVAIASMRLAEAMAAR